MTGDILAIVLAALGLIASFLTGWWFGRQGTNDAKALKQMLTVISRVMEKDESMADVMKREGFAIRRGPAGEPIGLAFNRVLTASTHTAASVEIEVHRTNQSHGDKS